MHVYWASGVRGWSKVGNLVNAAGQTGVPTPPLPHPVGESIGTTARFLAVNLGWDLRPPHRRDDMARELSAFRRQCERQITGDPPERRIAVACHCGDTLHVTISAPGTRHPAPDAPHAASDTGTQQRCNSHSCQGQQRRSSTPSRPSVTQLLITADRVGGHEGRTAIAAISAAIALGAAALILWTARGTSRKDGYELARSL